jgi:hypothetical protein
VGGYGDVLRKKDLNYVVINEDIAKVPSFLLGKPLEPSFMLKFDQSNKTSKIYDNQKLQIYFNDKGRT